MTPRQVVEAIETLPYYDDSGSNDFNVDRYREDVIDAVTKSLADEVTLRDLIRANRPVPVADENGDVHCLRLWPVARCQYVSGHYGGCSPR